MVNSPVAQHVFAFRMPPGSHYAPDCHRQCEAQVVKRSIAKGFSGEFISFGK